MMGGPPEKPLTALLAAALVLIVGAFVGGTLLTQAISSRMEADASDIANNAAPHVQQLTLARTALTKIRILAERANEECARQDAPFFADEIERMADEMQDSVATYLTAPAFPGEEALQQGLKKRMADLRSILTEYVGLSRAGQCETARALEKRLAESHGGSFGVRSSPGAGSTFWFEIPGAHRAGAEQPR